MTEITQKRDNLPLLWLIVLIMAVGMVIMAWKMRDVIAGNNRADLTLTIEHQERQLEQVQQMMKQYDQQFHQIAQHSNQLTAGLKSLDQTVREGNAQWRYTQVQFYLERAAQETYVMKDPLAARAWLQAALQNVIDMQQPNLLPIQEAIQQDIQDLSQNGGNAVSQAMVSLSVLSDSIHTLPLKQAPKLLDSTTNQDTPSEKADWRTALHRGWKEFTSLVRIRRIEGDIVPYLSQDEQALVSENVSLMLSEASFSAMRSNQDLYTQQVNQAMVWIKRYYDTTAPSVQEAISTLDHLSKLSVTFTPPTQLKSFNAWAQFIQPKGQPT